MSTTRGDRTLIGKHNFFRTPQQKRERDLFEKNGRIWNPGMMNHGTVAPKIKAPLHKEGTSKWAKFISGVAKTKSPRSVHALGGALQKEAARRIKKMKTKKIKGSGLKKKITKKSKGGGARTWQDTIKYVKGQNPGMRYSDILKRASVMYKKGGASMLP